MPSHKEHLERELAEAEKRGDKNAIKLLKAALGITTKRKAKPPVMATR